MDQSLSNGLEIDRGISIDVSDAGAWIIRSENSEFPLEEVGDFFRAWLLLERPFADVKAAIDRVSSDANTATPFPYWKLIGSALKAPSAQWTDRAMAWVPFLPVTEKASLKDLFIEARDSKWASQKSRQLARKYVNEIERGGQDAAD